MAEQFGVSTFKLSAEIEGESYELVQFQMSFGLNMVPRATALAAVGRNARNVSEMATVHRTGSKLLYLVPAKVYMEANGVFDATGRFWPQGRHMIFDGYLTGTSYRRSANTVQMSLDFVHWLADLQFSSCVSEVSHPNNPASYTYRAAKTLGGAGGGGKGGLPTWLTQHVGVGFFEVGSVQSDFWVDALLPFFKALADQDLFRATGASRVETCVTLEEKSNRQAATALARMGGTSKYYKKLTLQPGPLGDELGEAIARGVQESLSDSDYFQSFWDNLTVRLGPEFCFSVVPQIDQAFLAPIVPGLRGTWEREIYATDQEYVDFQSTLPRPLRAVALYNTGSMETQSGYAGTDQPPDYDVGPGGCFAPNETSGGEAKGQVLVFRAPKWLSNVSTSMSIASPSTSVYTKSSTTPAGSGNPPKKSPAQAVKDSKNLADWYCHYLYMCEALRGRTGTVAGKLRLDIAPGSTVKIHGSPERFLGGEDTLGINMIGLVHTVTCAWDAEQSKAGTGFGLTHLRTEFENEQDKSSIPIHPLYAQAYTGAPLLDDIMGVGGTQLAGEPQQQPGLA